MTTLEFQPTDTVYALAQSATTLYAARMSGLYHSQDGGATWQYTFASLNEVQPIPATAVAVTGHTVFAGVKGAVMRSDDAGGNWHIAGLSSPAPHVVALAVSPNYHEDGLVAAGTAEDGMFISNDGGLNWTAWNFGLVDPRIYALVISPEFAKDRTLFVGTESGIFRSQNGGRGWHELPFPMESAPVVSLGISPDGNTLYAGTEKHGLSVSDDGGQRWQPIHSEWITTAVNAIELHSPEIWLLLENGLVFSADGGHSWKHHTHQALSGKMPMAAVRHESVLMIGFADGDILPLR